MSTIFSSRYTAKTDQPFVVFIIGMRINKPWAVHKWLPVALEMPGMLAELSKHPEKGFMGGTMAVYNAGPISIQYWRSFEDLERFARNPDDPHLPAWKRFYQKSKAGDVVGVFHETYLIQPGQFEAIYSAMPRFGLGSVLEHVPATGQRFSASARLRKSGGKDEENDEMASYVAEIQSK